MCLRSYVDFESCAATRIANHIASHKSQNTFWKSNFDSLTLTIEIWRENFGGKSFDFLEKQLGDDFQEALDKGYFKKIAENKYIFTEKGREFAWKKEL